MSASLDSSPAIRKLVRTASLEITLKDVFSGTVLAGTEVRLQPRVGTNCTDGRRIWLDPAHWSTLAKDAAANELLHEVMHIVLLHCDPRRIGKRDPRLWGFATDYVINLMLVKMGRTLGSDWLLDTKYEGMSAEQVYEALRKDPPPASRCGCGGLRPTPEGEQQQAVGQILQAAAFAQSVAGHLPAEIEAHIKRLKAGLIPWERVLAEWLQERLGHGRSTLAFDRPDRRYLHPRLGGVVVPSLRGRDHAGTLVFAIDTSGSVGDETLRRFGGELARACRGLPRVKIVAMTCDVEVQEVVELRGANVSEIEGKIKWRGRGGTMFAPAFDRVAQMKLRPGALVFLTDGHNFDQPAKPPYPVLWALTTDVEMPFGRALRIREEGN